MHDEFLATPGYAAHVAAPYRHNPESFARLHDKVVHVFTIAGASPEMAEQSWFTFAIGVVPWLGTQQADHDLGPDAPRFDLYLAVLLRGLPTQEEPTTKD